MNGVKSHTQNRKGSEDHLHKNVPVFSYFQSSVTQGGELLCLEDVILFCYNIMLVKTPDKYTGQNGSLMKYMWLYLNLIGLRACLLSRPKLNASAKT